MNIRTVNINIDKFSDAVKVDLKRNHKTLITKQLKDRGNVERKG